MRLDAATVPVPNKTSNLRLHFGEWLLFQLFSTEPAIRRVEKL